MSNIFQRYQFVNIGEFEGVHEFQNKETNSTKADQIKVHQANDGIYGVPNKKLEKG